MGVEKQKTKQESNTGASLDQTKEQIRQNNPNFDSPKPTNGPGKKTMEVKATEYFTLLKTGIEEDISKLKDKEVWDLLSSSEQRKIKIEGWAILRDKYNNEKLINHKGETKPVTENNRRGYGARPKYGPLTTFRTIAVDKSKIPLGTWVYVDFGDEKFSGWYQATDVGSAIKKNRIDVFTGIVPIDEVKGGRATKSTHIPNTKPTITWFEDGKIHPSTPREQSGEATGEKITKEPQTSDKRKKLDESVATETVKRPKNYEIGILKERKRLKKEVSEKIPYNYHYSKIKIGDKESTIAVGGRPGCLESQKALPDIEKAKSQIKSLVEDRGIDVIVSMDSKKLIAKAVKELQEEGVNVEHEGYVFRLSDSVHKKNIELFEKLGKYINEGKSIYVHCRYGAHRAPSTTVGALLASGKVKSLGEAFYLAGLKLNNFTKNKKRENQHIGQLARYAASKGIPVETTMLNDGKIYTIDFKAPDGELNFYKSGKAPREVAERENLPEAGALHTKYEKQLNSKEIKEKKKKDKKTLGSAQIQDIRYNTRLLVPKEDKEDIPKRISNIKQETARRLSAYTSNFSKEWYTLDYQSVGGHEHEYGIGLGDILLDPDINEILVEKDGEIIRASKGLPTSGKHAGRPSFVDQNGNYVSTYTGDKFRILSKSEVNLEKETEVAAYIKKLDERHKASETHKKVYVADRQTIDNLSVDLNEKPSPRTDYLSDETILSRLNQHREENDAENIVNYAKTSSKEFNIPYAVLKELIDVESRWKPTAANKTSSARGLGQFLSSTWPSFVRHCNKNDIHNPLWGSKPLTLEHRFNPYCSIYATLWYMNRTKQDSTLGAIINSSPIHVQGKIYYLAHHEGQAGAKKYLKFLEEMQKNGHNTQAEVLAAYNENTAKYNLILHSHQRSRIRSKGINKFLYVYFNLCNRIGDKAYASAKAETPELVAAYEAELKAKENAPENKEKHSISEISVIGDSYAQGQWAGGFKSLISKDRYFAKDSTTTEHYIRLLQGSDDILHPGRSRRNDKQRTKENLVKTIKESKLIYIKLGGNEYFKGATRFKENMKVLIAEIRKINKYAKIVIPEIGPTHPKGEAITVANYKKKQEINEWIKTGGNGLFKPLIWAHLIASKDDPRYIDEKYASSRDKIHANGKGFKKLNAALLKGYVKEDTKVAAYIKKHETIV